MSTTTGTYGLTLVEETDEPVPERPEETDEPEATEGGETAEPIEGETS